MQIGDTYEYKNVVTKEITAGALGSGGLDIFATPFLICWMEAAAYYYMKEQLPEGKSSVGTMVNGEKVDGANMSMASDVKVYTINDDGDIEAISASAIKTNSEASVIYTVEDGEITNLFIQLPKD